MTQYPRGADISRRQQGVAFVMKGSLDGSFFVIMESNDYMIRAINIDCIYKKTIWESIWFHQACCFFFIVCFPLKAI